MTTPQRRSRRRKTARRALPGRQASPWSMPQTEQARAPAPPLRAAMDAQSLETGQRRWGAGNWRTLLTQGIAGKLDIAPRAVADDLKDSARALRQLPIPVPSGNVLRDEWSDEARSMVKTLNESAQDLARREAEGGPLSDGSCGRHSCLLAFASVLACHR